MCSVVPNIEELYMNNINNLVGTIPHSISNCSKHTILELANNQLTGLIPNSLGYLTHLRLLNLGANNLTSDSSLSFLTSLTTCRKLTFLDISFNPLNDMLPASTGNLSTSLRNFYANNYKIKGRIPNDVGNLSSLLDIDLPGNNLVGLIPTSIGNLRDLQRFNLSSNKFTGFIGDLICKLQHLGDIYLGQNQISGSLPNCLGNITSLREIHLGSNKLSSNIPPSLGNLQDLVVLHLSSNNMTFLTIMSGNIPKSLEKLQNLKYFNISVNKLYGEIPSGGPFKNLSSQFFIYNEALCGSSRFTTDALSESSLIGSGSFGSVYKGILRNRTAIAVKVFNLQLDAAFKSFDTESEVLRNLRHRNLVKVITSCSNLDFKALVLEQRLRIMIDVACALEYLHHGCSLPVIHCDVKPSNVLLDEDMVAHLSDFGISKLLGEDQGDLYTKALATLGYIALEYGLDGLVSTKCDVYSYGIMLLETFTRRKLNEFDGDLSLKQWASYSLPEAVMDVVDVNLVTPQGNHKELDVVALIMKVALDCCAESPARRTNMKDVVGMLQKIKIQLFAC
ncbi:hypothetical protein P3L10_014277 [Capsicum annuum]